MQPITALRFIAALALTALWLAPAAADEGSTEALSPLERARVSDASNDRGIVSPHADTIREGRVAINSYELFFIGLSYGVTDNLQLSATTLLPVFGEMPFIGLLNGKYVLMRDTHTVLSIGASIAHAGNDGDGVTLLGGAVYVDRALGDSPVHLHGSLDMQGLVGSFSGDVELADGASVRFNAGATIQISDFVRLLFEVIVPAFLDADGLDFAPVVPLNYGVRFYSGRLAADLSFIRPVGRNAPDLDSLPMGIPFVAFSAQF